MASNKTSAYKFVSVVIPTYNRKDLLKDCLESLFNQNYPKDMYEIIVVNDGSTDGTEEVLEEYEKKSPCRFKWFTQQNRGSYAARNLGIENAEGEIICFIDDDCIADRNWIKNLVKCFSDEEVGGVGGKNIAHAPETIVGRYAKKNILLDYQKRLALNSQGYLFHIITSNAAYKRNVLRKIRGFDTNFRSGGDIDLSIRVQLEGFKLKYCPEAVVYFKHRTTIKGLLKQFYGYSKGRIRLHKKYRKNYSPLNILLKFCRRLIARILAIPYRLLKLYSAKDKTLYISELFIDVLIYAVMIVGVIKEAYLNREYSGEVYDIELEKFISV